MSVYIRFECNKCEKVHEEEADLYGGRAVTWHDIEELLTQTGWKIDHDSDFYGTQYLCHDCYWNIVDELPPPKQQNKPRKGYTLYSVIVNRCGDSEINKGRSEQAYFDGEIHSGLELVKREHFHTNIFSMGIRPFERLKIVIGDHFVFGYLYEKYEEDIDTLIQEITKDFETGKVQTSYEI